MKDYKEYFESAKKIFVSTTQKVAEKSGEVYSTTKLSLKISKLKGEIEKRYTKIGEIVYANYKGDEVSGEDVETLCTEIENIYENIDELSAEIAKIRDAVVCPVCGSEIKKGSSFCAKCGAEI